MAMRLPRERFDLGIELTNEGGSPRQSIGAKILPKYMNLQTWRALEQVIKSNGSSILTFILSWPS
jgi:hypothetical protein